MNELHILKIGIRRTETQLKAYEERFGLDTGEFIKRYENNRLEETLDYAEWIGEFRLLNHLREQSQTLQGVTFAN